MPPWLRVAAKDTLQELVLPGRFLWRLPVASGDLALTFDDGPDDRYTTPLLDLLAYHDIRATFFLVGRSVQQRPEIARRIDREGHMIGSHSLDHRDLPELPATEFARQIDGGRQAICDAIGRDTALFRPPRGRLDARTLWKLARMGLCVAHWSRTWSDYRRDGAQALLDRSRRDPVKRRDILLLHDNNQDTIDALEYWVPLWKEQSLRFATLGATMRLES